MRTAPDSFASASSRMSGKAACTWCRPFRRVMPRSSSNPRIWLMTAVRRITQRSRTRCSDCISRLVIGFDRHEAHGWPCDSLGDRLSIDIVALVRLHVGLHILRRYQPHFVSLFPQCSAKKMRTSAGLHANQHDVYIRREPQQLCTRELLAHYDLAAQVKPDQMKNCLAKINADCVQFHGTPPPQASHTQVG